MESTRNAKTISIRCLRKLKWSSRIENNSCIPTRIEKFDAETNTNDSRTLKYKTISSTFISYFANGAVHTPEPVLPDSVINDTMDLNTRTQMHIAVVDNPQVITALTQLHFSEARSQPYRLTVLSSYVCNVNVWLVKLHT